MTLGIPRDYVPFEFNAGGHMKLALQYSSGLATASRRRVHWTNPKRARGIVPEQAGGKARIGANKLAHKLDVERTGAAVFAGHVRKRAGILFD